MQRLKKKEMGGAQGTGLSWLGRTCSFTYQEILWQDWGGGGKTVHIGGKAFICKREKAEGCLGEGSHLAEHFGGNRKSETRAMITAMQRSVSARVLPQRAL